MYNKTILIGRLTSEPCYKAKEGKIPFATFEMSNTKVKKKDDQYFEEVLIHPIVVFGKQADLVNQYIHKGDLICIEGRLTDSTYEDSTSKIIAEIISFLSKPKQTKEKNEDNHHDQGVE